MSRPAKPKALGNDETTGSGRGGFRPGSGRKPKPDALRKGLQITVALTTAQEAYVAQAAAANGVSPSEALRIIVDESFARHQAKDGEPSRYGAPVAPETIAKRLLALLERDIGLHLDPKLATRLAQALSVPAPLPGTPPRPRDGL